MKTYNEVLFNAIMHAPTHTHRLASHEQGELLHKHQRGAADAHAVAAQQIDTEVAGLQAALSARNAQCRRLEAEARAQERTARSAQADAARELECLLQQMGTQLEHGDALEAQLAAAADTERGLRIELAATRGKARCSCPCDGVLVLGL